MNNRLKIILEAAANIQAGLLRFRNEKGQQNVHVKIACGSDNSLYCVTSETQRINIQNKEVNIIQKYHGDYLFISGRISEEVQDNPRLLPVMIIKASWFIKKSRGSVSWFREKYTYENPEEIMAMAS